MKRLSDALIEGARSYIDKALNGFHQRLIAIEAREPKKGEPGKDGVGIAAALIDKGGSLIVTLSDGRVQELGRVMGLDGADADEDAVVARVAEKMAGEIAAIRAAVAAIPPVPEFPDVAGMIAEAMQRVEDRRAQDAAQVREWMGGIDEKFAAIPKPQDGKDADPEVIRSLVTEAVDRAVASIPTPRDGKSVTIDDVMPTLEKQVSNFLDTVPAPEKGDPGRDGLDVKDLFRADGGRLVAVMSDGTTKDLGVFVGKDGDPGRDGADGIGFDDMVCEVREDGVYLVFEKADIVKETRLPIPLDMGVYKADVTYLRGHCVTWGGSVWIAQKDNPRGKPDAPDSDWRLAVKRGRDGKDVKQ